MSAVEYIESYSFSRNKTGLHRERRLLALLGNPQDSLKFIHVAGSNGKGSCCAFMDSILRAAGYRVGLFTSPYLEHFNERIKLNGADIPGEKLEQVTTKVKAAIDADPELAGENRPTQFEVITAIAMLYYKEEGCDIVVLEVGMGGEFDATNVIAAPEAAVIMNIGLEHTQYLGDTLEKIAAAKGGIIKPGGQVVLYDGEPAVTSVITEICREKGATLHRPEFGDICPVSRSLEGQSFRYADTEYRIGLLGEYQLKNAVMAIEISHVLKGRGWDISHEALKRGLAQAKWPGRFEVLSREPLFILDGGHNPQCAEAMSKAVASLLPGKKFLVVFGVMEDKNYDEVIRLAGTFARKFICVRPETPRALDVDELVRRVRNLGYEAEVGGSVPEGLELALKELPGSGAAGIIAFGSLYLAGEVRRIYCQISGKSFFSPVFRGC